MKGEVFEMNLPSGLRSSFVQQYSDLIDEITGISLGGAFPKLAPTLLFSDPDIQSHIGFPVAETDQLLVQDFQRVQIHTSFQLDAPLSAQATCNGSELRLILSDSAGQHLCSLDTALRIVEVQDLSNLKPSMMPKLSAAEISTRVDIAEIAQSYVDRFLELSGDPNPIHRPTPIVAKLGLDQPVVPGLFLAALAQPLCGQTFPQLTITQLRVRFLAPLCVGESFTIALLDRGSIDGVHRLRAYFFARDQRILAIADLQLEQAAG